MVPNLMYSANASEPLKVIFPDWGIYILESHHSGEFYMPTTKHNFLKLIYVLEGEGSLSFEGSSLRIESDDLIVVPQEQEHQISDSAKHPLALIVLCIEKQVLENLSDIPEMLKQVSLQKPVRNETRKILRQIFFEQSLQKPQCALMITGLCFQLITLLERFQNHNLLVDEKLYDTKTLASIRVKTYIHYLQTNFYIDEALNDVAEKLGISKRYFSLLFKEYVGESWLSHIRNLRIEYAKKLLLTSDRSVTTITFECGFTDLSNFYRCFKKLEGTSPEKWRQTQQHGSGINK